MKLVGVRFRDLFGEFKYLVVKRIYPGIYELSVLDVKTDQEQYVHVSYRLLKEMMSRGVKL